MRDYSGVVLNKLVIGFVLAMTFGLSGCGGDDSAPQQTPPITNPTTPPVNSPTSRSITGGGIKGPLANVLVTVFAFDATRSGFKGEIVATAATDASTAITGLNLSLPLMPPYIMEFTSVTGTTIDITTGTYPVITILRTVITQALLNSGKDIYATPLTTLAVDIAVMNAVDTNGTAGIQVIEFEAALALAEAKVKSTLGFGLDSSVDIFDTPPLINSATISIAEQENVAGYRSAVEAITAIVHQISQQSVSATADTVVTDLAADLADNDMIDGSSGSSLNANTLQVLQQIPSSLHIPNTSPIQTIADVQTILADETAVTGSTTATTNLLDGTIVTQTEPVRIAVDTDGDGVFNIDDDLPDNKDESVDSDGDGIGDKADPDDDNDGILDVDEGLTSTPTANDTDGDGVADTSDNCPNNFNPAQTNSDTDEHGDACDLDDDGDGVDDVDDAFPVDGSKSIDTDSDGIDDSVDIDDDNDTIDDIDDTGLGLDGLTSCSLIADCDDDGVLDGADADHTDPNIAINFAPITINDAVTINEDAVAFLIDVTANDIDDIVNLSAVGPNDTSLGSVVISGNSIEYTPVANANGIDTFTYTVTDENFSSQGQVTVTIVAVNDEPVATDDTVLTSEDVAVVTGDVTANDVDVDGDVLTATLLANASNGNVVDNGNGTFRYTPNANFNGSDSFTYTVSDANGGIVTPSVVPSTNGTVNIIVNPVNDNPFASNDNASVNEDQSVNINLAANDTDIDSTLDLTSIVITFSPSNGTLVLNVNGTVDYTHDGSETIADSFTYSIKDSSGAVSNDASVILIVNPLNDAPVANNDSASVNKGQSVNINLAANDTDAEGPVDIASIVILTSPTNGTYVVNTNGTVDYTHDGSVAVTDVFTYTIQDTSGVVSNVANVALNVSTLSIGVIANVLVDENSIYTGVMPTITGVPIGAVTYTLSGVDAADFTINASTGVVSMVARDFESPVDADANNVYVLSITATDTNNNAASQSWTVSVQDVVEVAMFSLGVIANVNINENSVYTSVTPVITGTPIGALSYTLSGIDAADFTINATSGVVNMVARNFEVPADANTDNIYELSITASDADGNAASTSWSVTVVDVTETASFTINTIANASVNENSIYTGVMPTITGVPIGAVTYTLSGVDAADFTINASTGVVSMVARDFESPVDANTDNIYDLSVIATDENSNSASQSWAVSVQNVVELFAVDDSATVNEGQSVNINLAMNDVADNVLNLSSIVIDSPPSNATLVVNSNGTVNYIHDGSATITDLFTYTIRDTSGTVSNVATVSITVIPVNNTPFANDDNVTTIVDTTVVVSNVLANDTDGDGDVLSVVLPTPTTLPANGSVIYNGSGTFTYTPVAGFLGTDSFTYTVTDSVATAVGTVFITVTPPGTPINILTLMSSMEGGVAGIKNGETNEYAYWTDNYNPTSTVFLPEDKVYNHLSGVFDTVVNTGDLLLSGSQWVSEGEITGVDDGNDGLDLIVHDLNNANVEVASFKLTARYQDLSFLPITNYLNAVWRGAMLLQNKTFSADAKLITDYRFEALTESHILMHDSSCQKDGTTKFAGLNGNCNSVDVDTIVNATGYAQLLDEVKVGFAWVDPNNDFSVPPGAVTIAMNNVSNQTLMVQLVSGGVSNYYVVDWGSTSPISFVANAVAGSNWVQNIDSGVDMIHFQVPASFVTQFSDDLRKGLNYFLTVQNGFVRQGLKHAIGDVEFSDGQFNGNAINDILANFSAPVIPGLVELTGTWVNSLASANGDTAVIHIFANSNYESSGSCNLDGSTGMEYGTVLSSGSTTNIIATALVATQGLCGPSQGNKALAVNGNVLTLSESGFPDIVYNKLLGTTNPIVGSWLFGNIQDPGETHTILTVLDDTTFTLSQDCTTDSVSGFEYGTYVWDQGNTNNLTGVLSIDSNGGCGFHDNTALTISGFIVTVVGDTLTLTDTVGGGGTFIFSRVSNAYVVPMLQMFYTLDNLMMDNGEQITGSFTWTYVEGDFEGGSGQFTDLTIPGYGTDIAGLTITFDVPVGIDITLTINTNNNGVTINLNLLQPLSLTQPSPINLTTSAYEIEIGARSGLFVSGAISLQVAP